MIIKVVKYTWVASSIYELLIPALHEYNVILKNLNASGFILESFKSLNFAHVIMYNLLSEWFLFTYIQVQ